MVLNAVERSRRTKAVGSKLEKDNYVVIFIGNRAVSVEYTFYRQTGSSHDDHEYHYDLAALW